MSTRQHLRNFYRFYATAAEDVLVSRVVGRGGLTLSYAEVVYGQVVEPELARAVYHFLYRREGANSA